MPIPVTSENWEIICRLYKKIATQTYPLIKEAIQDIHLNISPSHTLGSKTFSLAKTISSVPRKNYRVECRCKFIRR